MIQERKCIKFAPRVRDLDKQYEANNNADLDNGVQHDFGEENKEDKNVSKFKFKFHHLNLWLL